MEQTPKRSVSCLECGNMPYYHPNIKNMEQVIQIMGKYGNVRGLYLLRNSFRQPGSFTLSVWHEKGLIHIQIYNVENNKYSIGNQLFDTIPELIDFFSSNPIQNMENLKNVLLQTPIYFYGSPSAINFSSPRSSFQHPPITKSHSLADNNNNNNKNSSSNNNNNNNKGEYVFDDNNNNPESNREDYIHPRPIPRTIQTLPNNNNSNNNNRNNSNLTEDGDLYTCLDELAVEADGSKNNENNNNDNNENNNNNNQYTSDTGYADSDTSREILDTLNLPQNWKLVKYRNKKNNNKNINNNDFIYTNCSQHFYKFYYSSPDDVGNSYYIDSLPLDVILLLNADMLLRVQRFCNSVKKTSTSTKPKSGQNILAPKQDGGGTPNQPPWQNGSANSAVVKTGPDSSPYMCMDKCTKSIKSAKL